MDTGSEWLPDFCLACDCQTDGGAYCSQACRLAEIDQSTTSSETASFSFASSQSFWQSASVIRESSGFLPPAFDFSPYRNPSKFSSPVRPPTSPSRNNFNRSAWANYSTPSSTTQTSKVLTPSSSGTSLSSMHSTSSQQSTVSEKARKELDNYANSFDQTRDWKRRVTVA